MKTLITLLIIFIPFICHARGMSMACGGHVEAAAPPAACDTQASPTDMETYAGYFADFATASTGDDWYSSMFVAGQDATLCEVCIYAATSTSTSPTYNVTPHIYSNNTTPDPDKPNASSGSFTARNMTGVLTNAYQWICWTGSVAITNGTIYHFVLVADGYDATNKMRWGKDATCASENMHRSADGSTWVNTETERCGMLKLYTVAP